MASIKYSGGMLSPFVALECSEPASELTGDSRRTEVEPFQHQRHDIALVSQSSLYLTAQPICRVLATFQRGGSKEDKEMCPCGYVSKYNALEVATGDTVVIEEDIIAVLSQVLENRECPRNIGAAITEKNGLLDAFHCHASALTKARNERYQNGTLSEKARRTQRQSDYTSSEFERPPPVIGHPSVSIRRPPLVNLLENRRRFFNGLINEEIFSGVRLGRIQCVDDFTCRQQCGGKQDGVLTFFSHRVLENWIWREEGDP